MIRKPKKIDLFVASFFRISRLSPTSGDTQNLSVMGNWKVNIFKNIYSLKPKKPILFGALSQISKSWRILRQISLLLIFLLFLNLVIPNTAQAGINDDTYEGNVYILYAGNGSLVPPRLTLAQTRAREMPAVLVYYIDDSSDCKQYSIVVSRIQEFYGRAASIIPVAVDSLPRQEEYLLSDPGYYYDGVVPQTVILDQQGQVVFNEAGQVAYEKIDDVLREVFDLLPRSESKELKRRSFNEFNTELAE